MIEYLFYYIYHYTMNKRKDNFRPNRMIIELVVSNGPGAGN